MKKFLFAAALTALLAPSMRAQTNGNEFDKKYRFGLRITPQPSWFVSNDKNNIPAGAVFGFGFGLNMEYKFSEVACLLTGIGGDFEGGRYKLRSDAAGKYEPAYWTDDVGEMKTPNQVNKSTSTVYYVRDRKISTTHISVPVILKLSTKEYGGMKYFGLFGLELAARVGMSTTDNYSVSYRYPLFDTVAVADGYDFSETGRDIRAEGSLIPLRLGLNAGGGAEYRLSGTTSLFASVSFFRSFSNLFKKESEYLTYRTDRTGSKETYRMVKQNLKQSAVRINIGIMF